MSLLLIDISQIVESLFEVSLVRLEFELLKIKEAQKQKTQPQQTALQNEVI